MSEYPRLWSEIAEVIKLMAGWKCEHCGHVHDAPAGYMLTVHHLDGDKGNCAYSNLVALCRRCHLRIQAQYVPGQGMLPGIEAPAWMVRRGLTERKGQDGCD